MDSIVAAFTAAYIFHMDRQHKQLFPHESICTYARTWLASSGHHRKCSSTLGHAGFHSLLNVSAIFASHFRSFPANNLKTLRETLASQVLYLNYAAEKWPHTGKRSSFFSAGFRQLRQAPHRKEKHQKSDDHRTIIRRPCDGHLLAVLMEILTDLHTPTVGPGRGSF